MGLITALRDRVAWLRQDWRMTGDEYHARMEALLSAERRADARQRELLVKLEQVLAQGRQLMTAAEDFGKILDRIDTATTNIGADVRAIKDSIKEGMTAEEVAEVKARAEAAAQRLEALDAENPEGQPASEGGDTPTV